MNRFGIAGDLLDKKVLFHPVLPGRILGMIVKKIVRSDCILIRKMIY